MNGLILLLIALPITALIIDGEKPGFVNRLEDMLKGNEDVQKQAKLDSERRRGGHGRNSAPDRAVSERDPRRQTLPGA